MRILGITRAITLDLNAIKKLETDKLEIKLAKSSGNLGQRKAVFLVMENKIPAFR